MWRIDAQGLSNEERAFQTKTCKYFVVQFAGSPPQSLISGGPKAHKYKRTQPGRE